MYILSTTPQQIETSFFVPKTKTSKTTWEMFVKFYLKSQPFLNFLDPPL